jgi:hypothetical protein
MQSSYEKAEAVLDTAAAHRAISGRTKKGALYSPEKQPIPRIGKATIACRQQGVEFGFGLECQASQVPGPDWSEPRSVSTNSK